MSATTGVTPSIIEHAFNSGKAFRIGYEFNLADTNNTRIIKVELTSPIVLTKSNLELDQGNLRYVVRSGATFTGTLGNPITVLRKNTIAGVPQPDPNVTFTEATTGSTLSGGGTLPIARVRTGGGRNTATSVSNTSEFRGFPIGVLYLELTEMDAESSDTTGILNLEWVQV